MEEYINSGKTTNPKKVIALTFDDGFRETYETIIPFLEEEQIPALIFASTSHINQDKLLWFNYLTALCFERQYSEIEIEGHQHNLHNCTQARKTWNKLLSSYRYSESPDSIIDDLVTEYPLPLEITSKYEGMTPKQLKHAGENHLIEIGGHTHTHPYLDKLKRHEKVNEILQNKIMLEEFTGRPIKYFAYPSNVYDKETIEIIKDLGFEAGFSVEPRKLSIYPGFEINRVGIYSKSILKLQMKLMGIEKIRYVFR
jgi:peptidoglycan/xylan/chitin deacetylase (PgdA/CDA1 family)